MIVTVEPDAFPEHFVHFQATVRHMFPILGFSPKEVERFIRSNSEIYEDTVFTVELEQGRSVLSYFVLDCYRTYERALNLYRRVGFSPAQFYTDATFWPEPGLQ